MAKDVEAFELQKARLSNALEDTLEAFYTMDYGLMELHDVEDVAQKALKEFHDKWTWDKPSVPGIIT